jgi:glucose-1-phosphate thymidylyltransferase
MPVTVILLAAGYATRLFPLTRDRSKALLPLGEGVILDEVLKSVDSVPDVRKRLLVTNHRFAEQFRRWQRAQRTDVQIVDDGTETPETRLGAIRDLELARTQGAAEGDLLVVGTDNLFSWPLRGFIVKAQRHRPHASIALWEAPSKESARPFGVVSLDGTSRITAFVEKSPNPPSTAVALAVYYFPEAMCGMIQQFITGGGNTDAPGYFLEWLVQRARVYGVMMRGTWYDIGTRQTYETVVRDWPRAGQQARA